MTKAAIGGRVGWAMHGASPLLFSDQRTIPQNTGQGGHLICLFERGFERRGHFRVTVPFIIVAWPGKLQKNESGAPAATSRATGIDTEVVSPPPTTLLCAMTRVSPALM